MPRITVDMHWNCNQFECIVLIDGYALVENSFQIAIKLAKSLNQEVILVQYPIGLGPEIYDLKEAKFFNPWHELLTPEEYLIVQNLESKTIGEFIIYYTNLSTPDPLDVGIMNKIRKEGHCFKARDIYYSQMISKIQQKQYVG